MTMNLSDELRQAAGWSERQDSPAPDWDDLLERAADEIEELGKALGLKAGVDVVLAARKWNTNADLILDAYKLGYVRGHVHDVTPGEKGLWLSKLVPKLAEVGIENAWMIPADHLPDGIDKVSMNHLRYDFRDYIASNDHFDTVLYDPPYKLNGNPKGLAELSERYGVDVPKRWQDRHTLMVAGLEECARITRVGGHVLAKCQNQVVSGAIRWQTDMLTEAGKRRDLEKVDEFHMLGHHIPQPMKDREQQHAHGRPSTLLVFEKKHAREDV